LPKTIRVARLGHTPMEFAVPDNATIDDVLALADLTLAKGESLAIDGEPVSRSDVPEDGETVYIVPSGTGGC